MKRSPLYAIIPLLMCLLAAALPSCIEDDFTQSPSDLLTFSTDTLSFDTVFTDQDTPTARLKVFNRAPKSVLISTVKLREPDSRFAINVDGLSGDVFHDVEIRSGDSIMVFVECKLPTAPTDAPEKCVDAIQFLTNGVSQEVVLTAWGQNVTRLKAHTVQTDMTLTAQRPIVVYDSLVVAPGATLTLDKGTQLLFHDKASLIVRGTLKAWGTPQAPVHLRGDRLDNVLPDVEYDIMAGQWQGVRITPESHGNLLQNVNMRSTVWGLQVDSCASSASEPMKLTIVDSWLHNSQGSVLSAKGGRMEIFGTCLSDAADHVLRLQGSVASLTQCTMANYYLFAAPTQSILGLYDTEAPMSVCLRNCIIYGLAPDLNVSDLSDTAITIEYTSLRSGGEDDEHFIECLWDTDPLFRTVREEYIFDYRVLPDSPVIGRGNPSFLAGLWPADPYGVPYLPRPTLGAYQFVPQPEE